MQSIQRLPSADSDETNASGSTDQTSVSFDDFIADDSKATDSYQEPSANLAEQRPRTSAIESFTRDRETCLTFEVAGESYFDVPVQSNDANSENQQMDFGTENKYNLESNICRRNLNALFEEFSDVRKSYERLKKYFLSLIVLNALLLICLAPLIPVSLATSRIEGNQVTQNTISFDNVFEGFVLRMLASPQAAETIRKNVFCGYCGLPKEFRFNFFEEPEEIYDKECCDQDIFTLFQKAKANFSQSATEFKSEIGKMHQNFNRLEDAVVGLEAEVYRDINDSSGQQSQRKSQSTILHQKVKKNSELLEILLNRKRSLIQLTGTVSNRSFLDYIYGGNEKLTWKKDFSIGDGLFSKDDSIFVTSGGTYFIYAKIQFSKRICNMMEMLEYRVMKQDERKDSSPVPVAHAKQSCVIGATFEQELTVQKLVDMGRQERASFYIEFDPAFQSYLSDDLKMHHFGIFEI